MKRTKLHNYLQTAWLLKNLFGLLGIVQPFAPVDLRWHIEALWFHKLEAWIMYLNFPMVKTLALNVRRATNAQATFAMMADQPQRVGPNSHRCKPKANGR